MVNVPASKTKAISAIDPDLGSFDWELSATLSKEIGKQTPEIQEAYLKVIKELLMPHLHLITAAMKAGPHVPESMNVVKNCTKTAADELDRLIRRSL